MPIMASILLISGQSLSVTAVGEPLLVPKIGFDCLVRNIDHLKLKGGEIRVDIRSCPAQNLEGFAPVEQRSGPVEAILVLDEKRLSCIKRNKSNIAKFAVSVGDLYRIDLKSCSRPAG
jgi:hypothetical protein